MRFLILLLPLLVTANLSSAEGMSGTEYLPNWVGNYKVISCPIGVQAALAGGVDLQNLVSIKIEANKTSAGERAECANTEYAMTMDFNYSNANGQVQRAFRNDFGPCNWGSEYKSLTMTADTFSYTLEYGTRIHSVQIRNLGNGRVSIARHVHNDYASDGFPVNFEYTVVAERQ